MANSLLRITLIWLLTAALGTVAPAQSDELAPAPEPAPPVEATETPDAAIPAEEPEPDPEAPTDPEPEPENPSGGDDPSGDGEATAELLDTGLSAEELALLGEVEALVDEATGGEGTDPEDGMDDLTDGDPGSELALHPQHIDVWEIELHRSQAGGSAR